MSGAIQALIGSLAGIPKDPNWASVTLLLPGNGTNAAQNNTFLDASTNNFTVTRNGNTTQGTFNPFTTAAPYDAAINGGSGYFDGAGDYLSVPNDAAFDFGTGSFTVEAWIYTGVKVNFQSVVGSFDGGTNAWFIHTNSSGTISYGITTTAYTGATQVCDSAWHHIAMVRDGASALKLYVDGALDDSQTNSQNINNNADVRIGSLSAGVPRLFTGYISNVRVVKGTAVYTAAFTPPTAPLTAITNTSLLLNFTNAGIIDNAMMNDLETVGNAQISTAQSKFGGSSIAFDGTGDWLFAPNSSGQRLMAGDFTVEFWMYLGATQANMGLVSSYQNSNGWLIRLDTTYIRFAYGITGSVTSNDVTYSFSTSTWYHVAWVMSGSSLQCYIDGTQQGSTFTVSGAIDTTTAGMQVGRTQTATNDFNGYIDDLRITKGVARYTANFTAPAAAFPLS